MKNTSQEFDLPYLDNFVRELEAKENSILERLIGKNIHWGYWKNPETALLTPESFQEASDALTKRLFHWAKLRAGQSILDVGCGFGGTIALLNETYRANKLVGLNIDARQIARARRKVAPLARKENTIDFVVGDAGHLPFPENSFDTVFAVECVFHFSSRKHFFHEAHRVLRPGGRLVLSDFVPRILFLPLLATIYFLNYRDIVRTYGAKNKFYPRLGYRLLAKQTELELVGIEDLTRHTLPTYKIIRKFAKDMNSDPRSFIRAQAVNEYGSKLGGLTYDIFAFEKPRTAKT